MRAPHRLGVAFVLAAVLAAVGGSTPVRSEEATTYERVAPIIQKHCAACHGPDKAKGDLRFDKLDPDLIKGKDGDRWREVLDRLNVGDMPPPGSPAMPKGDRELLTNWLVQERRKAALAKNPPTHFRRLTRREYERTMQDLLGLPIDFGTRLPEDGKSKNGFRNDGDALRMSPLQYETYLQIADEALGAAIVSGPAPEVHRFRFTGFEKPDKFAVEALPKPADRPGATFEYATPKGKAFRIFSSSVPQNNKTPWDGTLPPAAIRRHGEAATQLPEFRLAVGFQYAYKKGETRVRVRAARAEPPQGAEAARPPMLTVAIGSTNFHGVELTPIGETYTIDHKEPRTYEFAVRMENIAPPNPGPLTDKNATILSVWNSAKVIKGEAAPPRLKVEWVEFENPYFETWPPKTHTDILLQQKELSEAAYAREVIGRFAARAYRGPVSAAELDRLVKHWEAARKDADTLEDSLKEALALVLSSPRFLALPTNSANTKEKLTDHEFASRLSYFLWSTMPDAELARLAAASKLGAPATRAAQVRRMVKDAKAAQFIEQFPEQWLELDRLQRVVVNKDRYPGIDEPLLTAMRLETQHFFGEVLREDMSIFRLLDADFTFVNERLAAHYGIKDVEGAKFRKVQLDASHHRGGVLTHASVLTGNSDGIDGHPIKRGMWLLKNLLDDPPPPPPPNVPELNRDSPKLKNLTITQALAAHRDNTACVGCHRKIDPWGVAFEEYDAVGNWQRDGAGAELRKKRTRDPVDAKAELPGGAKVNGLAELRDELIRTRGDDFRRAMLRKVMAYALGRSLTLRDTDAADALVPALRERGDKFVALIELIVGSEPFQSK